MMMLIFVIIIFSNVYQKDGYSFEIFYIFSCIIFSLLIFRKYILDSVLLIRWQQSSTRVYDSDHFLERLAKLRVMQSNFVRDVRRKEKLIPSRETYVLLKQILHIMENNNISFRRHQTLTNKNAKGTILKEVFIELRALVNRIKKPISYNSQMLSEEPVNNFNKPLLVKILQRCHSHKDLDEYYLLLEWVRNKIPQDTQTN
jgi:hypothetical protein